MESGGTTVSRSIQFKELASLCEAISKITQKEKKRDVLRRFLESWRKKYEQIYPGNPQPPQETFHTFMRLLMPQADKERPAYGIKELVLAKLYIAHLGLATDGEAAQMLLHWKKNKPRTATNSSDVSDFAGVAYYVLQNRLRKEGEISVEEINSHLDGIADANSVGGDEKKEQTKMALNELLRRTDAVEQKWLIRMILKDLKFGMSEDTILNVFHPDARDLYDVTSSISTVCLRLNDPAVRMSEIEVSLFAPVRPMLADTWSPNKLRVLLKGTMLYAEVKYDGDRCQLHKRGNQYKYFSRAGNDNTDILGGSASEGTLTQYIADCFRPDLTNFILDGEIVAYSTEAKCIATKAESYATKKLTGESGYQVCFVAFDVLLLNDKTVTGSPLRQRLNLLKDSFQEEDGRLYHAVRTEVTTPDECYDYLNKAIDRNEEGIMLKDPSSVYKPNSRTGGWWKVKPEFVDSLSDQLDVLVVGAFYGGGRRTGISHFLLAVAEAPDGQDERPTKFLSFCKVGSGYTYKELHEMAEKLKPHLKPWTKTSRPDFLIMPSGDKGKADLWLEPWNSFIVKVAAAQVLDSDDFATGCTLRFPRMKEPRYDKPWYECVTYTQLVGLKTETSGRLGGRNITDEHVGDGPNKKKARTAKAPVVHLAQHFRPADLAEIHSEGNIFSGKVFYVAGGDQLHSKQDLERLIAENGGTCVQNPGATTFCVVCQKMTLHVRNVVKQTPIDVVLPTWILSCVHAKRIVPWQSKDLLSAKKETVRLMKSVYDRFGDSFTESVTTEDVERLFRDMSDKVQTEKMDETALQSFQDDYFPDLPMVGMFRLVNAYIDKYEMSGSDRDSISAISLSMAEVYIHAFGGSLDQEVELNTSHVIVYSKGDTERWDKLKALNHERKQKFHLVTEKWVIESVEEKRLLEERGFVPRAVPTACPPRVVSTFQGLFDVE